MAGTIIVGAGQAGAQVAISLRQGGYRDPILLLGAEAYPPYERPPLSKELLAGKRQTEQLALRKPDFYTAQGITLRTGARVTGVDRAAKTVLLADGEVAAFHQLVWAAGGRARRLTCPGADAAGVHVIRTIDDVAALSNDLTGGRRRVIVIGGGYIGLEAAAVLREQGHAVTIVEAQDRLLARVTAPPISDIYRQAHHAKGVLIRLGTTLSAMTTQNDRITGLRLADGEEIPADLIIVGIGIQPNIEPLADAGVECPNGVRVDAACRSSDPDILAVGDCALFPNPYAVDPVRLESVPNAVEQARIAAASILGTPAPAPAIPWFWSNQYNLRLQSAGLNRDWDRLEPVGNPDGGPFALRYFRQDRLIAVDCINMTAEFNQAKREILPVGC
ncbi:hypothetical protein CHU95_12835 [Niveispirillum lacus]|uniref:Pyridine nucleotide-disulfide oxidoreductase n=1 Tax=Niveispirillum lacus TaxID=1981099 RepID=A0A255YYN9_9PROT|nr:FAD-dependent oxidoreductase [Niveispirillum lacus]OYQ34312.1 hypothetical protein CHU95_12835 [Niveispirillum lacus]